jgi:hypothetical protein
MPEIRVEILARMHVPGRNEPSIYPLGEARGETDASLANELRVLFLEMPNVIEAIFRIGATAASVDEALARRNDSWTAGSAWVDADRAFRDRALLADEVARLRLAALDTPGQG